MSRPRPKRDDLLTAAEWLRCNDGRDGEGAACALVAEWLEEEITARNRRSARRLIRRYGVDGALARLRAEEARASRGDA